MDGGTCDLLILGVVEDFTNIEELGIPGFELRMNEFLAGKGEEIRGGQLIKQRFKGGRKKKLSNNLHGELQACTASEEERDSDWGGLGRDACKQLVKMALDSGATLFEHLKLLSHHIKFFFLYTVVFYDEFQLCTL